VDVHEDSLRRRIIGAIERAVWRTFATGLLLAEQLLAAGTARSRERRCSICVCRKRRTPRGVVVWASERH